MSGTQAEPTRSISVQLLAALRQRLDRADIEYAEPPAQITGGFDTQTYRFSLGSAPEELSGPLILRLYPQRQAAAQGRKEAAFQNALAGLGYPVPRVLLQADGGVDGRPFNVMELVPGQSMMGEIALNPESISDVAMFLGRVHARLHQIPVGPVMDAVDATGLDRGRFTLEGRTSELRRYFRADTLSQLLPGLEWLEQNEPESREGPSVLHGDFHPGNVMVDAGKVSGVIDWPGATFADPELDVAATLILIAAGGGLVEPAAQPFLRTFADRYLEAYQERIPLDMEKVAYHEVTRAFRAFTRGTALHTPGIDPDLIPRDNYAWAGEYAMRLLAQRISEITGIELPLPPGM